MPSRAYASFLQRVLKELYRRTSKCQCPHGLMPHFYDRCVDVYVNFGYGGVNALTGLCLISTGFTNGESIQSTRCVNALTGLCLISTWTKVSRRTMCVLVSMPSRAYASFLQYPFKNLGFMRFPEPVFAGICQNILTVTVFRAC